MSKGALVFNAIILLGLILLGGYSIKNTKKTAYINTSEVFNNFKMTKEIDVDVKKVEEKKQNILDSIAGRIKEITAGIVKSDDANFNFLKNEFLTKRERFSDEISGLKQASIEKVWKQINQYLMEYGKDNNYDIIMGATGQGSLMYANENINITQEVTEYINKKYEGVK